jgi:hypothetical protein
LYSGGFLELPVTEIPLDSSTREEDVTLLHGRNLLIKLIQNKQIRDLLEERIVQEFLSTEDLCDKEFRLALSQILKFEEELNTELGSGLLHLREQTYRQAKYYRKGTSPRRPMSFWSAAYSEFPSEEFEISLSERLLADLREGAVFFANRIERIDHDLLASEEKLKRFNDDLEVLEPTVVLRCPRCGIPVFKERKPLQVPKFQDRDLYEADIVKGEIKGPIRCVVCHFDFDRRSALRINLHILRDQIREVWNSHVWLEDYVSRILQSMQWKTWIRAHVLGSSGVRHEVDVLGVKESYVLVCECKTGNVSRQDVFNFWAKAYDIRSHVNMLALVEALPEPETREFVTKNPSLFLLENLGNKRRSEIVSELKSSIVGRI